MYVYYQKKEINFKKREIAKNSIGTPNSVNIPKLTVFHQFACNISLLSNGGGFSFEKEGWVVSIYKQVF